MSASSETSFFTQFLCAVSVILVTFVYWIYHRQSYFKRHNIPFVKSIPLLGSFGDALLGKIGFYDAVLSIYNQPEVKDKPFFGMFICHKPGLMIKDPEILKSILVKDFNYFEDRYNASDVHDPLGNNNLFSVKNPLWRKMRGKLTPFFTSGKLKSMYYLVDGISNNFMKFINKGLDSDGKVELEMKEVAAIYSTDIIASCAFGVEANSFVNPNGEFRKAGHAIFNFRETLWRSIEFSSIFMLPQVTKFFGFKLFSSEGSKFIQTTIPLVMTEREKSGNKRNDLIDTLIELKKSDDTLSDDILQAQAAAFFSAGKRMKEQEFCWNAGFCFYVTNLKQLISKMT